MNRDNPLDIFKEWLAAAQKSEMNDPDAMCLATCDANGQPSVRMVLLKDVDERGFKFHTNEESRKGREIAANAKVALNFHWKSLRKQVCVQGVIEMASDAEADEYFAGRPHNRQIGAWASQQSRPLESREVLEQSIAALEKKFEGVAIPRPPYWRGYIVRPHAIEFWMDNPDRLHDRFLYVRDEGGAWAAPQRLYP